MKAAALLVAAVAILHAAPKPSPPQTIPALQAQIEKILHDTHTPGVSLAIVHRDGPEWITALGAADVATNRKATADTLFRIGSVSKAFTALAVQMLVRQGKLSLEDPVRLLAPEVFFENPWEATDPIRVVHLLEHTAGWEDIHLREFAHDVPESIGLREVLDYDHTSRISRWRPGTRMAYCNSGAVMAGYIVEKLTGQRLEDFVAQHLFSPIGMKTATYFEPPTAAAATLYHDDGVKPYPYSHIGDRPSGAINASANDMAAYLRFYLNRGTVNGTQVVPASDIDRAESPTSTWAAKAGLKAGYGLGNYWTVDDGFVFHGHNGGLEGAITDMGYLPDAGIGYFYSVNSASDTAPDEIGKAIRAYITRDLTRPPLPPVAPMPPDAASYAGFYQPDAPRSKMPYFFERLVEMAYVQMKPDRLHVWTLDDTAEYLPVVAGGFRKVNSNGHPDPVATLQLLPPNREGRFLASYTTLKRIPTWFAVVEIALTVFTLAAFAAILVYAPFWLLAGFSSRRRRAAERAIRIWPLLAVLIFAAVVVIVSDIDLSISDLGTITFWSIALWFLTLAFALATFISLIAIWRSDRAAIRPNVRRFSITVTAALLIATAYLAYWGIIGIRTWA